MTTRTRKLLGLAAVLGVVAVAAGMLALHYDLRGQFSQLITWVRAEGAGVFFVAMAVLPLFGVPLSPFVLTAGPVFGPSMGPGWVILCGVVALGANVAVSYALASYVARGWLERVLVWLGYALPKPAVERSWEFTVFLRVFPGVPFFLQNYLLGLARVRFGVYMLVSVLVPAVHLSVAVLAGDAIVQGNARGLLVAGVLFAVVGLGLHRVRKFFQAKRREAQVDKQG